MSAVIYLPMAAEHFPHVRTLMSLCYADMGGLCAEEEELALLVELLPQAQWVAMVDGVVVGASLGRPVPTARYLGPHTQEQTTDLSRYRDDAVVADTMYGMDVVVHPGYRRLGIALGLQVRHYMGAFQWGAPYCIGVSRVPGLAASGMAPQAYLQAVCDGTVRDPVLTFHIKSGVTALAMLENYNPGDTASAGCVALVRVDPSHVERAAQGITSETRAIGG